MFLWLSTEQVGWISAISAIIQVILILADKKYNISNKIVGNNASISSNETWAGRDAHIGLIIKEQNNYWVSNDELEKIKKEFNSSLDNIKKSSVDTYTDIQEALLILWKYIGLVDKKTSTVFEYANTIHEIVSKHSEINWDMFRSITDHFNKIKEYHQELPKVLSEIFVRKV